MTGATAAGIGADGRFAPSPTGPLHLGALRTALTAWLFARSQSARFRLRIEDLDPQRSRAEWEASQFGDLRALGLDWDGEVVRQSERRALYEAALTRLAGGGHLYPCFCTRAEIREAASAPHGDLPEGAYPGTCSALSPAEADARIAAGERHALRVRAGGARVAVTDRIAGPWEVVVDDFVVRRTDGIPAYQLAVVVDDADQGIGEVVRGADLLSSTPRQILLGGLLGLPIPRHAHVGLVLDRDGRRLAKRHRAATLADRNEPASRTLALLAHTLGLARDRADVRDPADLLPDFRPERLDPAPVVID